MTAAERSALRHARQAEREAVAVAGLRKVLRAKTLSEAHKKAAAALEAHEAVGVVADDRRRR